MSFVVNGGNLTIMLPTWVWAGLAVLFILCALNTFAGRGIRR